ncbi:MAG: helix-turn-helix domain-containing protein, partial [Kiritimatiellae bacterium]|nr:helix-turn-helix domain-containing protein [Kiritimatiellia bacterium]
ETGSHAAASSQAAKFKGKSLKAFLRSKEKEYLSNVMNNLNGDKEKAAQALDISVATLYRKLSDKS